jgi:sugar phosphate isomerase/epimerase
MSYNRRQFLQSLGLAGAGSLLAKKDLFALTAAKGNLGPYGLQLWSVQNEMAADPKGVLKKVASYGYRQIESFEGKMGMFWGMTPGDFRNYSNDLGMQVISSHFDDIYNNSFDKKAADAGSIGMKYLISPSESGARTADDFKKLADRFNECGKICKKNGLKFGYHNHDVIFKPVDNQVPMDILLANTDPENVVFEMDIYWAVTAGADPQKYLRDYKGRFRLCHVKDRIKGATERDASCIVGEGSIDFPLILHTARACGVKYYIVEQERFDNTTPLLSAAADAKYLADIKI